MSEFYLYIPIKHIGLEIFFTVKITLKFYTDHQERGTGTLFF